MMTVSPAYAEQNRILHATMPDFGQTGHMYVGIVRELVEALGTRDILDYGCGKRTLEAALGFDIVNYDPCLPGLDATPEPHDIVVCNDVLEHVEPSYLAAMLADLRRVTRRVCFLTIYTAPAEKTLPDGRNAHLIVAGQEWWLPQLWEAGFTLLGMTATRRRIKATVQ